MMLDVQNIRNSIICGDATETLKQLPDCSIDLAVTSPPYNLGGRMSGGGDKWRSPKLKDGYESFDDRMPEDEYISWQREVIRETLRVLRDDGAFFYNTKWFIRGGLLLDRREITEGFPLRQIIIWQRPGGVNFVKTHFLPTYEVIYLIAKKDYRLVDGANKYTDIWKMNWARNNEHPAPFPIELPEKAISASLCMERRDAIVLDPFMGSGTTAVAALMHRRSFIGIEKSESYCEMARGRLARIFSSPSEKSL